MGEWMPKEYPRLVLDTAQYAARLQADSRAGRCFICDLVDDENSEPGALIVAIQPE